MQIVAAIEVCLLLAISMAIAMAIAQLILIEELPFAGEHAAEISRQGL